MYGLTTYQPWAHLIIWGEKDVENRVWRDGGINMSIAARVVGARFAVHAAKDIDEDALLNLAIAGHQLPAHLVTGAIIGTVQLVAVEEAHQSQWAAPGCKHLVLNDPRPCDPVPMRGYQGFYRIKPKYEKAICQPR